MSEGKHTTLGNCEICGHQAILGPNLIDLSRWYLRCGHWRFNLQNWLISALHPDGWVGLSAWVREQNDMGFTPALITPQTLQRFASKRLPSFRERSNRALLGRLAPWLVLNDRHSLHALASDPELQGRSYSASKDDTLIVLYLLIEDGSLVVEPSGLAYLTIKGILAAEALGQTGSTSAQGFVAMSFDLSLNDVWADGFYVAIEKAGYVPLRIDQKDYVGGITDEMITEIRKSKFLVADYTEHRGNVYFEAGFALGLGLTVIQTCRETDAGKVHFDVRHLNTLVWKDANDLAEKLSKRITAVLGAGPHLV